MTFQDGTVLKALYGIAAIALIAVIGYALWKMEQHNLYLSQISLAVLVPVFISPISWFHHAVILPIFYGVRGGRFLAAGGSVAFSCGAHPVLSVLCAEFPHAD